MRTYSIHSLHWKEKGAVVHRIIAHWHKLTSADDSNWLVSQWSWYCRTHHHCCGIRTIKVERLLTVLTCHAHSRCPAALPTANYHAVHFPGSQAAMVLPSITHHTVGFTRVAHTLTMTFDLDLTSVNFSSMQTMVITHTHAKKSRWKLSRFKKENGNKHAHEGMGMNQVQYLTG